jgi:hypothetical protein
MYRNTIHITGIVLFAPYIPNQNYLAVVVELNPTKNDDSGPRHESRDSNPNWLGELNLEPIAEIEF